MGRAWGGRAGTIPAATPRVAPATDRNGPASRGRRQPLSQSRRLLCNWLEILTLEHLNTFFLFRFAGPDSFLFFLSFFLSRSLACSHHRHSSPSWHRRRRVLFHQLFSFLSFLARRLLPSQSSVSRPSVSQSVRQSVSPSVTLPVLSR